MSPRPTRARLLILALLFVGTLINYLDRTVISVAALPMREELGLDAAVMGVVFSAFSWTYAAAQIPGGLLIDRIGVRLAYFLSVSLWSAFTLLQGFTTGLVSLLGYRLGLGVAEAPAYPCNSRVLNTWFPQSERARATGVYSVGQYAGLAFLSPLLFWIVASFGWRMLFISAGVAGLLFALLWWWLYRDPAQSQRINQAEMDYITAGGAVAAPAVPIAFSWSNISFLLKQRQVLGASIGQFTSNSTLVPSLYVGSARVMWARRWPLWAWWQPLPSVSIWWARAARRRLASWPPALLPVRRSMACRPSCMQSVQTLIRPISAARQWVWHRRSRASVRWPVRWWPRLTLR